VRAVAENQTGDKSHEPQQHIKCPYCPRAFYSHDELTLHIVTRHTQVGIKRGPAAPGSART
jgi:hypothetical protein